MKTVPRLLLVITDLEIGGTPTVVRELSTRLTVGGAAHVEVASLAPWGPVASQIVSRGITVHALGAKGPRDLPGVIWKLRKLIVERQFSVVFSFLMHANAVAAACRVFTPGLRWIQSIQTTQPWPG